MTPPRDADRWLEMDLTWFDPTPPFDPQLDVAVRPSRTAAARRHRPTRDLLQPRLADRPRHGVDRRPGAADPDPQPANGDVGGRRRTGGWPSSWPTSERCRAARPRRRRVRYPVRRLGPRGVATRAEDLRLRQRLVRPSPRVVRGAQVVHRHARPAPGQPAPRRRLSVCHGARRASPRAPAFADLFGAQWASFAEFTGFDAILLRDGFCGPMIYTRNGPTAPTLRRIRQSSSASAIRCGTCSERSSKLRPIGWCRLLQRDQPGRRLARRLRRLRGTRRRRLHRRLDRADVGLAHGRTGGISSGRVGRSRPPTC